MTEERWAAEQRPDSVLFYVEFTNRRLMTSRKVRLFACGCYRLIWDRIELPSIRRSVELAEARADRMVKQSELGKSRYAEGNPPPGSPDYHLRYSIPSLLTSKVTPGYVAWLTRTAVDPVAFQNNNQWKECSSQADMARCIFGNPFRSVALAPEWRTDTAVSLARGMYEARDFAAMPILADALQDAGCDSDAVLNHCRDATAVRVRGCWVVDRVLGKA